MVKESCARLQGRIWVHVVPQLSKDIPNHFLRANARANGADFDGWGRPVQALQG